MDEQWRFVISTPDIEKIQRESLREPCLQIGDSETYYEYFRRMEIMSNRARELRDWAYDTCMRGFMRPVTAIEHQRGLPSSSVRRPVSPYPTVPIYSQTVPPPLSYRPEPTPYRSPIYTPGQGLLTPQFSSASAHTHTPELSPRAYLTPRPTVGLETGVQTPPSVAGGQATQSPLIEYSTWGYTGIAPDSDSDGMTTVSAGSGYMMRVPRVTSDGVQSGDGPGASTSVTRVGTMGSGVGGIDEGGVEIANETGAGVVETVIGATSGTESSSVQVWVPESPVVEVLVISSAEDPSGVGELDDEELGDAEDVTETATTIEGSDDADYEFGT